MGGDFLNGVTNTSLNNGSSSKNSPSDPVLNSLPNGNRFRPSTLLRPESGSIPFHRYEQVIEQHLIYLDRIRTTLGVSAHFSTLSPFQESPLLLPEPPVLEKAKKSPDSVVGVEETVKKPSRSNDLIFDSTQSIEDQGRIAKTFFDLLKRGHLWECHIRDFCESWRFLRNDKVKLRIAERLSTTVLGKCVDFVIAGIQHVVLPENEKNLFQWVLLQDTTRMTYAQKDNLLLFFGLLEDLNLKYKAFKFVANEFQGFRVTEPRMDSLMAIIPTQFDKSTLLNVTKMLTCLNFEVSDTSLSALLLRIPSDCESFTTACLQRDAFRQSPTLFSLIQPRIQFLSSVDSARFIDYLVTTPNVLDSKMIPQILSPFFSSQAWLRNNDVKVNIYRTFMSGNFGFSDSVLECFQNQFGNFFSKNDLDNLLRQTKYDYGSKGFKFLMFSNFLTVEEKLDRLSQFKFSLEDSVLSSDVQGYSDIQKLRLFGVQIYTLDSVTTLLKSYFQNLLLKPNEVVDEAVDNTPLKTFTSDCLVSSASEIHVLCSVYDQLLISASFEHDQQETLRGYFRGWLTTEHKDLYADFTDYLRVYDFQKISESRPYPDQYRLADIDKDSELFNRLPVFLKKGILENQFDTSRFLYPRIVDFVVNKLVFDVVRQNSNVDRDHGQLLKRYITKFFMTKGQDVYLFSNRSQDFKVKWDLANYCNQRKIAGNYESRVDVFWNSIGTMKEKLMLAYTFGLLSKAGVLGFHGQLEGQNINRANEFFYKLSQHCFERINLEGGGRLLPPTLLADFNIGECAQVLMFRVAEKNLHLRLNEVFLTL